jgi:serine/threonine protein kinase
VNPALATVTDPHGCAAGAGESRLEPGTLLGGRYLVQRRLGAGGMGEVYAAHDRLLGDPVAVKLLRVELAGKANAQARFAEEIRLARRITHRNVCRVHDVGIDGTRVYYTMELCAGETLRARLDGAGPMTAETVAPIVRQLLDGIAAAHATAIVHADLKPSNVLLEPDGRVVVTDFGLALPFCATPACACDMAHLIGTPAYMAPEQVTGSPVSEASDLFSFGVIGFELLTGALPWHGETELALAHARLSGPPPSPRTICAGIAPRWDEVIVACLAPDPRARPRSAAAVARMLGLA